MARPVVIAVVLLLLLALLAGGWLWWRSPARDAPAIDTIENPPVPTAATSSVPPTGQDNAKSAAPMTPLPALSSDETTQDAPEVTAALQSMNSSLAQGDARTPELAPQYEREKPSAEVLANPELYEEYELGEARKIAAIYLSMLGQIPVLRARIEAAKAAGSKSEEELAEAEEALAKLEELKREIERDHPDMLPAAATVDEPGTAPPDKSPADE